MESPLKTGLIGEGAGAQEFFEMSPNDIGTGECNEFSLSVLSHIEQRTSGES